MTLGASTVPGGGSAMMIVSWAPTPIGEGWDVEPDAIVWVSIPKLEQSFADGDQYVGPGGTVCGTRERYETVGRHILSGRVIWMPYVSLGHSGEIRFTDGRHRFAWVRDHGAAAIPVTTDPDRAHKLASSFGSDFRLSKINRLK
jgi:hypothetical protein